MTFADLFMPYHDTIIIPVSSDPFNLKIVERKGKNTNKYLKNEKKHLD